MTDNISALIEHAQEAYPRRTQASTKLSALGARALPYIIEQLRRGPRKYRLLWRNILLDMEPPELVPAMIPLVNGREKAHIVATACHILAHSRDPRALAPLCEAVTREWAPFSSFEALGDLGDPDAIPVLREIATELLGDVGDLDALATLAARAVEEDYVHDLRVLIMVATALAKIGDQAMAPVAVALTRFGRSQENRASEDLVVRMEAVVSLRHVVGSGMVPALSEALRDSDPEVVENALDTALYLGSPEFVPDWIELLRTEDDSLAVKAYQAIYGLTGQWPVTPSENGRPDPDRVASWWEGAQADIDGRVCTRLGQAAYPPLLFPLLGDSDTLEPARAELHAITGMDFAPALVPFWGLDLDPVARAESWWQKESARFEAGRLYRFGRRYELAAVY